MSALYFLSIWLHLFAAAVWVGGMVFLSLGFLPTLRHPDLQPVRSTALRLVALRWRVIGWVSLLVLLLTGIYNIGVRGYGWGDLVTGHLWTGAFGRTLLEKVSTFALLVLINALHDLWVGPKVTALARQNAPQEVVERWRKAATALGILTLLLSLWLMALGVMLVRGRPF